MVIGVIGENVHRIEIRIVEHALRQAGLKIVSLGAQISQEQFIDVRLFQVIEELGVDCTIRWSANEN